MAKLNVLHDTALRQMSHLEAKARKAFNRMVTAARSGTADEYYGAIEDWSKACEECVDLANRASSASCD